MKDPARKPKRDRSNRPAVDTESLDELWSVIGEYRLDNNAAGWFTLPWRSGWNVVKLLLDVDDALQAGRLQTNIRHNVYSNVHSWCRHRIATNDIYWLADGMRSELGGEAKPLAGALRCVQLTISKSHGGGAVFNDILHSVFASFDASPIAGPVQAAVLDARCHDAIGVGVHLANDRFDRQRRAFRIAWERGLYHAAYAIPPVVRDS